MIWHFISFLAPQMYAFIRHQASPETSYYNNLILFDRYCAGSYPDADTLTQEMIDNWCRQRPTEENNSCRSRIYVVYSFVCFLNERELSLVRPPKLPKKERCTHIPHAFTNEELSRFFCECDSIKVTTKSKTDLIRKLTIPVFFRLLYSSGIRTVEARMLMTTDVDLVDGILNIKKSKGTNQHYVVLHDSMLNIMQKYDKSISLVVPERKYFFPSLRNGHFNSGWVVKNFNILWRNVNESHATAYDFRHNYAVENVNKWIGLGFDYYDKLVYLSKSMGHCNIESMKYYYSITPGLSDILEKQTTFSSDWIIPEVSAL